MSFILLRVMNATITGMKVYAIPDVFSISNSVTFVEAYIANSNFTEINTYSSNITILDSMVRFISNTTIAHLTADGSNINLKRSKIFFTGYAQFTNNTSLRSTGAIQASERSTVFLTGKVEFNGNEGYSGAIKATGGSVVVMGGIVSFIGNKGHSGGAITLHQDSYIRLQDPTYLVFKSNAAKQDGGAIYVLAGEKDFTSVAESVKFDLLVASFKDLNSQCIFQPSRQLKFVTAQSNPTKVQLMFDNNTAGSSGMDIYGGSIDTCRLPQNSANLGVSMFSGLKQFALENTVTSDPTRVCIPYSPVV